MWGLRLLLDSPGLWCMALLLVLAASLGAVSATLFTPWYDRETLQATLKLGPQKDLRESTTIALEQAAQFRSCPVCEVMVEREGGCNVITCANCEDRWCFVCGGRGCRAWACASLESADTA